MDQCQSNGVSEAAFSNKINSIKTLEMCFFNFPTINKELQYFTGLQTLCILAQELESLNGLEACPHLESLTVCETRVSEISHLTKLTQLKELYLYSNFF
jgi:Leucine-rich repeat (LRR) protein